LPISSAKRALPIRLFPVAGTNTRSFCDHSDVLGSRLISAYERSLATSLRTDCLTAPGGSSAASAFLSLIASASSSGVLYVTCRIDLMTGPSFEPGDFGETISDINIFFDCFYSTYTH
jgi:hypothetical protein